MLYIYEIEVRLGKTAQVAEIAALLWGQQSGRQSIEALDDYDVRLKGRDQSWVGTEVFQGFLRFQHTGHGMGLLHQGVREGKSGRIFVREERWQVLTALDKEEGAFGVPPKEDIVFSVTPHKGKGIELTIQRPYGVDPAMPGFRVECGTEVTISGMIGYDRYLATTPVRKISRVDPMADGLSNLHIREIRAKKATGFRESAADFTPTTHFGWNNLGLKNHGETLRHYEILMEKLNPPTPADRPIFLV
ncbi:MAG: hypothetical protein R3B74_02705 [Nitrospirales bacterium]|nr:hypothetical protein [Nitrospirales bacterium]